jgi:Flp pilus assembly protein CpaB
VENIMSSKLFTTRQGTVLLGVIAAVIAAIALLVYLNHYRNSVKGDQQVKVLVAAKLIQKGTPGDVVRTTSGLYQLTDFSKSQVESGAIVNPSALAGKVAVTDIALGQQLTAADFGTATGVAGGLGKNDRLVVIPLGSPQEVASQITAGSHVDVWVTSTAQGTGGVTRPIAKLLFQDMRVAAISGGNVTLQATPTESGELIFASTNDSIWLALRPTIGTKPKPPVISANMVTGG